MNFGNPVRGKIRPPGAPRIVGDYRVTQKFGCTGVKAEPALRDCGHFHRGIDVSDATCGKAVIAAQDGKVKFVGEFANGERVVILNHFNGWGSSYDHLAAYVVMDGETVTKGQKIGDVGATGFAFGCHLHFAVKSGLPAGWGKLDFVPDAFGGRGDRTGRWEDPWALLEQNIHTGGVAAPKEVPNVPNPSTYIPGFVATIRNNTGDVNVRAAPNTGATIIRQIPAGTAETWVVTCWEKGELTSGSDQWLARWAGRWEYVHKISVASGPTAAAPDCVPAVKAATDPLVAKLGALKTKVAALAADVADD